LTSELASLAADDEDDRGTTIVVIAPMITEAS